MKTSLGWAGLGALTALAAVSPARADEPVPASRTVDAGTTQAQARNGGTAASPAIAAPGDAAVVRDGCPAERFVILDPAASFAPALIAEVRTDLAAELSPRGIAVCDPGSSEREPAARVELTEDGSEVVIELDDRVTHKRVARDLPLAHIPANGRALAIAIAIDELLRASWAELTLERSDDEESPSEQASAPAFDGPIVRRPRRVKPPPTPPRRTLVRLGGDLGFVHAKKRFDAFALSARAALHPGEIGWLQLSLGGLASIPSEGTYGKVLASGLRSALTLGLCSRSNPRAFGCVGGRGGLDYLSFRGLDTKLARAETQRSTVVHASFVGLLAVMLSSELYVFGEVALGAVTKGARATDGTSTLMGVTGLLFSFHLGLGFEL